MQCPFCGHPMKAPPKLELDLNTGVITAANWSGHLSPRQAEVLHVLLARMPEMVSMEYLIQRVYGMNEPGIPAESIRSFVRHVKMRLKGSGYCIKNEYGYGYALRTVGI